MPVAIDKPSSYFNTITYTGTGATNSRTVGFQPDFFWFKNRGGNYHVLGDSIRGITKFLYSNDTSAEVTNTTVISSLDSTGYTLGNNSNASERVNYSADSMVAWNWLAGGTGVSNTNGSITSTVSANTTSGFSIVSYTGNGTAGATIGHGLGSTPKMMIVKPRSAADHWAVYHASLPSGASNIIYLNLSNAYGTSAGFWNNTTPTSSVFSVGSGDTNVSSRTYIAYCFADVKGFSKFGSYTGNGSADGTFVYTGFKPKFVMVKTTGGVADWYIIDTARNPYNAPTLALYADTSNADVSSTWWDINSNGFKLRNSASSINGSGITFIYMAFAENPFTSSKGIPCTAR